MNNAQRKLFGQKLRALKKPQLIAEMMELAKIPECWHALEELAR